MLRLLVVCVFSSVAFASLKNEELSRNPMHNPDLFGGDMMGITGPEDRNGIPWEQFRWPNAEVPYVVDSSLSKISDLLEQVFNDYKDKTCVRFVPRTNQENYIKIFSGKGCYSHVGMTGGEQAVSLGEGCHFMGTVIHELAHTLGFYHEQNRSDRDEYLNIFMGNVEKGMESNFAKLAPNQNILLTPFDYDSIMIYGTKAFSKDGHSVTMRAKNNHQILDPYHKNAMTDSDITRIRKMYNCQ